MSIPYTNGFETGNLTRARVIQVSGPATSVSNTAGSRPSDSPSEWYLVAGAGTTVLRFPWYRDATSDQYEAPDTGYSLHFRRRATYNDVNNDIRHFGVGRNGVKIVTVSQQDSTAKPTIVIAGTVKATAASYAASLATWERLILDVTAVSEGATIDVYASGDTSTPVVSYTLTAGDVTTIQALGLPNEAYWTGWSSDLLDDIVLQNPNDATGSVAISDLGSVGIRGTVFNGAGTYADWTGTYAAIDEVPASDVDFINSTTVNEHSSFTIPSLVGTAPGILALTVRGRVIRGDSTAGDDLEIQLDDGVAPATVTVPSPGDGDVALIFNVAPDGGAFTVAGVSALEFGFLSRV